MSCEGCKKHNNVVNMCQRHYDEWLAGTVEVPDGHVTIIIDNETCLLCEPRQCKCADDKIEWNNCGG